jgi:diguanylate cyclase (GGDEF)-like protein
VPECDDAHAAAVEEVYGLIEAAQGQLSEAGVLAAGPGLLRGGWDDVRVLLTFARSLAVREAGGDDAALVREMLDLAAGLADPALHALALATTASRRAEARHAHPLEPDDSSASPLVRAVALLDDPGGLSMHRACAHIEIGVVSHTLGLWELAIEHYEQAELAIAGDTSRTARRQRVVLGINRIELIADWACAHAVIGDRESAAGRARAYLDTERPGPDGDWPPGWVEQHDGHLHLLAALAGVEAPKVGPVRPAIAELAAVLRTMPDAGEGSPAVLRTVPAAGEGSPAVPEEATTVPPHARLLAMRLAAQFAGAPEIALRYADELAALRWNDRLHRVSNIRAAIAVERRRREHEQLRRDLLTDDLTGLANRRGYHAYLDDHSGDVDAFYAVLMVDVDRFKAVNDGFGHDVGDLVLTRIAGILGAHVRPGDLAARLGGDEFVVIFAAVPAEVPGLRAQEIIDAVRGHAWRELAAGLSVSISVGVHLGGGAELPGLITGADRNLYRAKDRGRGRVVAS